MYKQTSLHMFGCCRPKCISVLLTPIFWLSLKRRENESFGNATKRTLTTIKRFIVKICLHLVIIFLKRSVRGPRSELNNLEIFFPSTKYLIYHMPVHEHIIIEH